MRLDDVDIMNCGSFCVLLLPARRKSSYTAKQVYVIESVLHEK